MGAVAKTRGNRQLAAGEKFFGGLGKPPLTGFLPRPILRPDTTDDTWEASMGQVVVEVNYGC